MVRDVETGRRSPGRRSRPGRRVHPQTDAQGRFRLTGQPKRRKNHLNVEVEGQPYIKVVKAIATPGPGTDPSSTSTSSGESGSKGRSSNRADGRPVKAVVQYYPFRDNPHLKEYPDASFLTTTSPTRPVPHRRRWPFPRRRPCPGGGILTVRTTEPAIPRAKPLDAKVAGNVLCMRRFKIPDGFLSSPGADRRAGRPLGSRSPRSPWYRDGRSTSRSSAPKGGPSRGLERLQSSEPVARRGDGGRHRIDLHPPLSRARPRRSWSLQIGPIARRDHRPQGRRARPDPLVLQPTGTVIGRLVDEDGTPRSGANLSHRATLSERRGSSTSSERFDPIATGPDGRFRIKNLVPGSPYTVEVIKKK